METWYSIIELDKHGYQILKRRIKTPEQREKISKAAKMQWERDRENILKAQREGCKKPEYREFRRKEMKRRWENPDFATKVRAALKRGREKPKSRQRNERASKSVKKAWITDNGKMLNASLRNVQLAARAKKGTRLSDETKKKMSIAQKKSWANNYERKRKISIQNLHNGRGRRIGSVHEKLLQLMKKAGIHGFQTDYHVGSYWIDEFHQERKLAIEVQGCYWHGCSVCKFRIHERVVKRIERDLQKKQFLYSCGISIIEIWEHEINETPGEIISRIQSHLN